MPIQGMNSINNSSSDEHEELLAEMELIERLPTQERLKQAKRRRALQLKKFSDYDREYILKHSNKNGNHVSSSSTSAISDKHYFNDRGVNHRSSGKRKRDSYTINSNIVQQTKPVSNRRSIRFQDHIVLLDAIMRKDYEEVERLLENVGVTPNSANEDGLTAIHQCCIDDSADLLRLLIKNGADVNVCDNDLWTPLHAAATCANLEICKILIENKAELLAVNTDGNMPYDICDDELCLEFIESEMAHRGVTQQAIDMKRSETEMRMLDDLKQICMTTNSFSSSTSQLVQNSFLNSNNSSLQNFTSYFADAINKDGRLNLNAKDNNCATLMHIACANGYTSILEFLLIDCQLSVESGAPITGPSISVVDNDGWTPLHVATFWGHQKAIEILLEHGADINLKTNNDENVLDLCDDPDIRDFIIQKNKEIESQQEQAAALAALQKQMLLINNLSTNNNYQQKQHQNISNTSSANGSIRNTKTHVDIANSRNENNSNNSTRSLKRTSTGVSRSSSVRRSSFRDKEKAARKLDTSFKDVLYAQNLTQTEKDEHGVLDFQNNPSHPIQNSNPKNTTVVKIINNKINNSNNGNNEQIIHTNNEKSNQNLGNTTGSPNNNKNLGNYDISSKNNNDVENKRDSMNFFDNKKTFVDDHNNNQLKIIKSSQSENSFDKTKTSLSQNNSENTFQVARVLVTDGSAAIYSQNTNNINTNSNNLHPNQNSNNQNNIPTILLNNGTNPINQSNMSSNFSMTSSLVSSTMSNHQNASSSLSHTPNPNMMTESLQSGNTISASSIAIIDMNNIPSPSRNSDNPKIEYLGTNNNLTSYKNNMQHTVQPTFNNDFLGVVSDGVKYKFVSNETIGAKNGINNEFCDLQSEEETNKFRKCLKCIKCCFVM